MFWRSWYTKCLGAIIQFQTLRLPFGDQHSCKAFYSLDINRSLVPLSKIATYLYSQHPSIWMYAICKSKLVLWSCHIKEVLWWKQFAQMAKLELFWSFFGTKHHDKLKHETILVFPKVNEGFFVFNPRCYLGHRLAFSCWTKRFAWHVADGNLVVVVWTPDSGGSWSSWSNVDLAVDMWKQKVIAPLKVRTHCWHILLPCPFFFVTLLDGVICLFWRRGPKARAKEPTRHASLICRRMRWKG